MASKAPTLEQKYRSGVHSAKARGYAWTLTFEDYVDVVTSNWDQCSYCHQPILNAGGSSLDRVHNNSGYHRGNVVPCCGTCNTMRGTKPIEQWWSEVTNVYFDHLYDFPEELLIP